MARVFDSQVRQWWRQPIDLFDAELLSVMRHSTTGD